MTNIPVEERVRWIGSSESAALLGVSPYTTRFALWHEKRGILPRASLDGAERIEAGRFLEPAIASWAGHKWSWRLVDVPDYLVHPTVGRMGASLDFSTVDGQPVEIKNVDRSVFREHWAIEGEELINAPAHYLVQVQHQLACRPEAAHGWLVVCVGGNALYRMQVGRHAGLIARIEAAVTEFWRSIDAGQPPEPDFEDDGETIASLFRRGDGSTADLSRSNRAPIVLAEYLAAQAEFKAAERRKETAMAEIRDMVGAASRIVAPAGYQINIADIPETVTKPSVRSAYRRITIKAGVA